jgi:hypothetical protein
MGGLLDRVDVEELDRDLTVDFSDELTDQFEQDLPSSAFGEQPASTRLGAKLKPSGAVIPAAMRRRVEAEILLYLELANGACEMACAHCAEFAEQHLKPIAKRAANIVARYPDLAEKLVTGGILGDWIALLIAVRPVIKQVTGHHVTHSIRYEDEETGGESTDYSGYGPYRPN